MENKADKCSFYVIASTRILDHMLLYAIGTPDPSALSRVL